MPATNSLSFCSMYTAGVLLIRSVLLGNLGAWSSMFSLLLVDACPSYRGGLPFHIQRKRPKSVNKSARDSQQVGRYNCFSMMNKRAYKMPTCTSACGTLRKDGRIVPIIVVVVIVQMHVTISIGTTWACLDYYRLVFQRIEDKTLKQWK